MQKQQLIENKLTRTPNSERGSNIYRNEDNDNDETATIEQIFENNMIAYING